MSNDLVIGLAMSVSFLNDSETVATSVLIITSRFILR